MTSVEPGSAARQPRRHAVCTIVSKNYLASARALAESLRRQAPGVDVFVLLVDRVDGYFDPAHEPFTLIEAEQLPNIVNWPHLSFKYTILELNTAVKPYFLEHLFDRYGYEKVIYFDPDIYLFAPLTRIWELLDEHSAVVTPHLTEPIADERRPSETDILRSGAYNLGFIALADTPTTRQFLSWWQKRLYDYCRSDMANGYFTDQKWVDLAPGMFGGFFLLRDPQYNVAYWNFHSRAREVAWGGEDKVTLANEPLCFFHYSGFNPERPKTLSKYQNRFSMANFPNMEPLFAFYADALLRSGYGTVKNWPYAYAAFDNGTLISNDLRALYHGLSPEKMRSFGNPFESQGENPFLPWANSLQNPDSVWWDVYRKRDDVRALIPDAQGRNRQSFYRWIVLYGMAGNSDALLPPEISPQMARAIRRDADPNAPLWRRGIRKMKGRVARVRSRLLEAAAGALAEGGARATPRRSASGTVGKAHKINRPFGVNVAGYLAGEFGVAEAARGLVHALGAANVPYALNNIVEHTQRHEDETFGAFRADNPYAINLLNVNADVVPTVREHLGAAYFPGRYNIGAWYWELSRFPEKWSNRFDGFDELWVASAFCLEAIGKASPVPVVKITSPIHITPGAVPPPSRARFDLPEDAFAFVFSFDYDSVFERKNPLGVIAAFREAFGDSREAVLVLKSLNAHRCPERVADLRQRASGLKVRFLDEHLSRAETLCLLATGDCFVSLHRSEGLGLGMAEAMYLGKPVIATAYSGNLDFMTVNNSYLVEYRLVELAQDYGSYERGNVWAEPDLLHAATQMRRVFTDRAAAAEMGRRASEDIKTRMSPAVAGREVRERLEQIARRRNVPIPNLSEPAASAPVPAPAPSA